MALMVIVVGSLVSVREEARVRFLVLLGLYENGG
jgi:hypothetical protein